MKKNEKEKSNEDEKRVMLKRRKQNENKTWKRRKQRNNWKGEERKGTQGEKMN